MLDAVTDVQALNDRFALGERARFVPGVNSLPRLAVRTAAAEADLYLHGGHVTHFQPAGSAPLLYLSPLSPFVPGRPIRGGIPLCFPWFGPQPDDPALPAHGFVRQQPWQPLSIEVGDDGDPSVRAVLGYEHRPADHEDDDAARLFTLPFRLTLTVTVTSRLSVTLTIENIGPTALPCEPALHTYLAVHDVRRVQLLGLENTDYLDKTDRFRRKTQPDGPVTVAAETDRVYLNTTAACRLIDVPACRHILIEKSGSNTTVVWNPWVDKTHQLPDLPDHDWPHLLCVETANAAENALRLAPGRSHTMATTLSVEPIL